MEGPVSFPEPGGLREEMHASVTADLFFANQQLRDRLMHLKVDALPDDAETDQVAILGRQLPLDFLVEADALDGTLDKYSVLYLTDNHVSSAASTNGTTAASRPQTTSKVRGPEASGVIRPM